MVDFHAPAALSPHDLPIALTGSLDENLSPLRRFPLAIPVVEQAEDWECPTARVISANTDSAIPSARDTVSAEVTVGNVVMGSAINEATVGEQSGGVAEWPCSWKNALDP